MSLQKMCKQAEAFYKENNWPNAALAYRGILDMRPGDYNAVFRMAECEYLSYPMDALQTADFIRECWHSYDLAVAADEPSCTIRKHLFLVGETLLRHVKALHDACGAKFEQDRTSPRSVMEYWLQLQLLTDVLQCGVRLMDCNRPNSVKEDGGRGSQLFVDSTLLLLYLVILRCKPRDVLLNGRLVRGLSDFWSNTARIHICETVVEMVADLHPGSVSTLPLSILRYASAQLCEIQGTEKQPV